MIAFNSTYFYLIVCYAHMKIFLLYIRNTSFIFIYLFVIIIIIIIIMKTQKTFSIAYKW